MAEGSAYSLSDIASAMRGGDGFGGMGGFGFIAILFLFVLLGGGGMWGGRPNAATQSEMQQGFDNQNSMANQRELLTAVTNGTAQSVAATNQTFHDMIGYVADKYAELDRDVLGINSLVQQSIANENQCCCNTLRAIDGVNFNAAQNTAAINANTAAQTQKILDAMAQSKIDALQNQVNQLQLQQAVAGVVRYPMNASYSIPVPNVWGVPQNPPFFG